MRSIFFLWSIFVFNSCMTRDPGQSSISKAGAVEAFEKKDYDQAIAQFTTLYRQSPDDSVLTQYLAQSYLARAGISLSDVAKILLKNKNVDQKMLEDLPDFFSTIPSMNVHTQGDVREALRIVQDYSERIPQNLEIQSSEVVYRMLYIFYLVKQVHLTIVEEKSKDPSPDTKTIISYSLAKHYTELSEIVSHLGIFLKHLDDLEGRIKRSIKKQTDKRSFSFRYRGDLLTLDLSQGYQKGVSKLIQDILLHDYRYTMGIIQDLRENALILLSSKSSEIEKKSSWKKIKTSIKEIRESLDRFDKKEINSLEEQISSLEELLPKKR